MTKRSGTTRRNKHSAKKSDKYWETYEEVARYVIQTSLRRFGLSKIENKQLVEGQISGTHWEIDAKGISDKDGKIIIIECRRYTTSRISQEGMAAIAFRILDTGAGGGIVVSPHPLQKGAKKIAKSSKVQALRLDPSSTVDVWVAELEDLVMFGLRDELNISLRDTFTIKVLNEEGKVIDTRSG